MECEIYQYRNFREYLRDWFSYKKKSVRGFSYRYFSRLAGFASPNFLKLVIDGKRNISDDGINHFYKGLSLNKEEQSFFYHLVHYTQSENHDERVYHEKKMMRSRRLGTIAPLERDRYQLFSAWYHPVILELLQHPDFDGTASWLMHKIGARVTLVEIQRAMALLTRLGFVAKDPCGKWRPAESVVSTGAETSEIIMLEYHRSLMELARDVVLTIDQDKRDLSSLTIGITNSRLGELKTMIQDFRKQVIAKFATTAAIDDVVFLNIQMFPVTNDVAQGNK